jgi:opacity protein-like surface antigen
VRRVGFPISGYLVGGTVGANYQTGAYIFGIEGDLDWTNLHGGSGSTCGAISDLVPPPASCQTQSEWLATVRGRVGYTVNNVLIYGTGGAAVGSIQTGLIPPSTFDNTIKPNISSLPCRTRPARPWGTAEAPSALL